MVPNKDKAKGKVGRKPTALTNKPPPGRWKTIPGFVMVLEPTRLGRPVERCSLPPPPPEAVIDLTSATETLGT
eukprot:gene18028-biopygen26979